MEYKYTFTYIRQYLYTVLCIILLHNSAFSQEVEVSLPDTTISFNTTVSIPLKTTNLTGLGVISFDCTIIYNSTLVEYIDFNKTGTLSSASTIVVNSQIPGQLIIGAAQTQPLQGSGVLLYLIFRSKATVGTAAFSFHSFIYSSPQFPNEQLAPTTHNGALYVLNPASPPKALLYPNPFSNLIIIEYQLPTPCQTVISIYDITGRKVRTLWSGFKSAGIHLFRWDGNDDAGIPVGSGIYFCRINSGSSSKTYKITYIK